MSKKDHRETHVFSSPCQKGLELDCNNCPYEEVCYYDDNYLSGEDDIE